MAVSPVSLAASLQPWQSAGLTHLIVDDGSVIHALLADDHRPVRAPARQPKASVRRSSVNGGSATGFRAPAAAPTAQPAFRKEEWPSQWQALLDKTPRAPIVWTYMELGEDLQGRGDKARSACLRELISSLRLPRGSSAFWPLTLPPGSGQESACSGASPQPDSAASGSGPACERGLLFRQGLLCLRPRAIIFFGLAGLEYAGLTLPLRHAYTQHVSGGILHVLLPEFSRIVSSGSASDKTAAYLRSALAGLPGLFA